MKLMIHAHTRYSADGELSVDELAAVARKRGFDAVLVSDHFESLNERLFARLVADCRKATACLMIPGYERSFRGFHILGLSVARWFGDRNIGQWSEQIRGTGGITAVAHPSRYNHVIPADILEACDAVEVWNSKFAYDGEIGPNPRAYDLLGAHRRPLCSQDLHGTRHASPVGLELQRTCTTGDEIIQCIQEGDYRMSNSVLRFDRSLSPASSRMLALLHRSRRRAVKEAIRARKYISGLKLK